MISLNWVKTFVLTNRIQAILFMQRSSVYSKLLIKMSSLLWASPAS